MNPSTEEAVNALALNLVRELIVLTEEKWVGAARFSAIADRHHAFEPSARVFLLTAIRRLVREMPVGIFADAEVRDSILAAAQEALDSAIEHEDARG